MTYIVNENCIKCKYTDCVEVCPVDCFYEGENMLVIHPDECIDCGVCEPECPVEAILPDTEPVQKIGLAQPQVCRGVANITRMIEHSADASSFEGVADKFKKYFSENRVKVIKSDTIYFWGGYIKLGRNQPYFFIESVL